MPEPNIIEVKRDADEIAPPFGGSWHSDWSFQENPPSATLDHSKIIPPIGGESLFLNTQIPVCLWFLTNDKTQRGRDRRGETLFIDARQMGTMKNRVERILTDYDISKISNTFII